MTNVRKYKSSQYQTNKVSVSCFLSGVAIVFYFLSFWFCKPSYDEKINPPEDKTDGQTSKELECIESAV